MSQESIARSLIGYGEEAETLEELKNVRDFGVVDVKDLKKTIEENQNYWRVPTMGEMFNLFKKNKKSFFKYKNYWAKDLNSVEQLTSPNKYRQVPVTSGEPLWYYNDENPNTEKGLIMFRLEDSNPEPTEESYPLL